MIWSGISMVDKMEFDTEGTLPSQSPGPSLFLQPVYHAVTSSAPSLPPSLPRLWSLFFRDESMVTLRLL